MKKLTLIALSLAFSITCHAITPEEAIASKNYYVIYDYCRSNNIVSVSKMLFKTYNLPDSQILEIYNSITNIHDVAKMYFAESAAGRSMESAMKFYDFDNIPECFWFSRLYIYARPEWINQKNIQAPVNGAMRFYVYQVFEKDLCLKSTNTVEVTKFAISIDKSLKSNKYCILVKNRTDLSPSQKLDLSIALNDVDGIIDAIMVPFDISASQAESLISPLNAVAADYRKSDILKGLNNINSICTIKLYDDQKTWEPILAKIRAMISVRK